MKIGVIGGAGVRTVIFINGLLKRYQKLNIDTVVLYDINREKLEVIAKLCNHVVAREGKDLVVRYATDPVEAIRGMDYIVTTLRVGGDHSRVIDETVALKNGVIGQETTGVGGFSMAVRTIPVLMDYCRMIAQHAPQRVGVQLHEPVRAGHAGAARRGLPPRHRHLRRAQQHEVPHGAEARRHRGGAVRRVLRPQPPVVDSQRAGARRGDPAEAHRRRRLPLEHPGAGDLRPRRHPRHRHAAQRVPLLLLPPRARAGATSRSPTPRAARPSSASTS